MSGELGKDRDAVWQNMLELRSQRENVERWLNTDGVPDLLQEQLRYMLRNIEVELQMVDAPRLPDAMPQFRETS